MGFYEEISKYYDRIFPAGKEQLEWIQKTAGLPPERLLDVACGSGTYAVELAGRGYDVTAVDLDDEMVRKTREKARLAGVSLKAHSLSMLELADGIHERDFRCVYCIGNSIVHLQNQEEIGSAVEQMAGLLQTGGSLLLQIMNYDRILHYGIDRLPTIREEDGSLVFERRYLRDGTAERIFFDTTLTVNGERYENSIPLFPLRYAQINQILQNAGLRDICFFGDFLETPYSLDSYVLVAKASKK